MALTLPLPQIEAPRAVALLLAIVAGYVDACTFIGLFGFFIAQVTGSFVFVGAAIVSDVDAGRAQLLAVPMFFLAGVVTVVVAALAQAFGRSPLPWTLALETVLLAAFMTAGILGQPFASSQSALSIATALLGIAAMGTQSGQVRLLFHGAPSTNVMTLNTSQMALDATQLVLAKFPRVAADDKGLAVLRQRLATTLLLAVGFFAGIAAGAAAFVSLGFACVALPVAALVGLVGWATWSR